MAAPADRYMFTVTGAISEVESDLWRARSDQWGLTTYGKTGEEAYLRMDHAISLMVDALARRGMLEKDFTRVGIRYRRVPVIGAVAGEHRPRTVTRPLSRRFEREALISAIAV